MYIRNWMFPVSELKEEYEYHRCQQCGCLFRVDMDIDYSIIYNDEYGASRGGILVENESMDRTVKNNLKHIRDSYAYMGKYSIIGKFLNYVRPAKYPYISVYKDFLSKGKSFIDMGCRRGDMVVELKNAGVNAYGAEPYMDKDIIYSNGAIIRKKFIYELDDTH